MGHLTMVRVLDAGFGMLATGTGAFVFRLWTMPAIDGVADASMLMAILGALILLLVGGLGVACLLAALRLGRGRGRMLQTFLACSLLLTFPVGTLFALYALWVCWAHPEVRRHLARDSARLKGAARPEHARCGRPLTLEDTSAIPRFADTPSNPPRPRITRQPV